MDSLPRRSDKSQGLGLTPTGASQKHLNRQTLTISSRSYCAAFLLAPCGINVNRTVGIFVDTVISFFRETLSDGTISELMNALWEGNEIQAGEMKSMKK
ncbi:MAG: hypothetical protein K6C08_04080 [Oscillospiraceae bacterium]|nr:hypothetical protein [Oscillospiraceae bacterium]